MLMVGNFVQAQGLLGQFTLHSGKTDALLCETVGCTVLSAVMVSCWGASLHVCFLQHQRWVFIQHEGCWVTCLIAVGAAALSHT